MFKVVKTRRPISSQGLMNFRLPDNIGTSYKLWGQRKIKKCVRYFKSKRKEEERSVQLKKEYI